MAFLGHIRIFALLQFQKRIYCRLINTKHLIGCPKMTRSLIVARIDTGK